MKDRAKRDKEKIKRLEKYIEEELQRLIKRHHKAHRMCRELIRLCLDSGADPEEIFNIVKDDHFLRKEF